MFQFEGIVLMFGGVAVEAKSPYSVYNYNRRASAGARQCTAVDVFQTPQIMNIGLSLEYVPLFTLLSDRPS